MTSRTTCADIAGIWKRELLYEPRDVLADSALRDGSLVYWAQSPQGAFVDVRYVRCEKYRVRGFAGRAEISHKSVVDPSADPTAFECTWHRHTDSMPSSCPTGIDHATCRVIGELTPDSHPMMMEEGDGYLEVWRRVAPWTPETDRIFLHVKEGDTVETGRFERIQLIMSHPSQKDTKIAFESTATDVSLDGFGVKLTSASQHESGN